MEKKIREVKAYLHYFDVFFGLQKPNVQRKITFVLDYIENKEGLIPEKFLKHIQGSKGLYEVRVEVGSDIFRIFSFFDEGKLIVLANGFQKKSQKTPKEEIKLAEKLMKDYFESKKTNKK